MSLIRTFLLVNLRSLGFAAANQSGFAPRQIRQNRRLAVVMLINLVLASLYVFAPVALGWAIVILAVVIWSVAVSRDAFGCTVHGLMSLTAAVEVIFGAMRPEAAGWFIIVAAVILYLLQPFHFYEIAPREHSPNPAS